MKQNRTSELQRVQSSVMNSNKKIALQASLNVTYACIMSQECCPAPVQNTVLYLSLGGSFVCI